MGNANASSRSSYFLRDRAGRTAAGDGSQGFSRAAALSKDLSGLNCSAGYDSLGGGRRGSRLVMASALLHQPGFNAGGHEYLCHPPQTFCPAWISRRRMWKFFFVQCSTIRNERILEDAISSLALDPQLRRHPRHALQYVRTKEIRTITDACQGDRHFQKQKVVSLLTREGLSSIAVGLRGRCSVSDGSFKSDSS